MPEVMKERIRNACSTMNRGNAIKNTATHLSCIDASCCGRPVFLAFNKIWRYCLSRFTVSAFFKLKPISMSTRPLQDNSV